MQKAIVVIIAVAMMLTGCSLVWADENVQITDVECEDGCTELKDATLSGLEVLGRNTRIFQCKKQGEALSFQVNVIKGKPSVRIINQSLNSLRDDYAILNEIVQFIINTGDGTDQRVWCHMDVIVSY